MDASLDNKHFFGADELFKFLQEKPKAIFVSHLFPDFNRIILTGLLLFVGSLAYHPKGKKGGRRAPPAKDTQTPPTQKFPFPDKPGAV